MIHPLFQNWWDLKVQIQFIPVEFALLSPGRVQKILITPLCNHYDINNLPIRGHAEWLEILEGLECDGSCNDLGIKFRSPLLKLSSIIVPFSFCIDSMHLILENLVNTLWNQLRGFSHEVFKDPQVPGNDVLSNDDLKQIEREIVVS